MRKIIYLILFITLQISCKKEITVKKEILKSDSVANENFKENTYQETNKDFYTDANIKVLNFMIEELYNKKLVGMEISENLEEPNPYKKYSLDISNYCYSCTLASLLVNKETILIENFCDPQEKSYELDIQIANDKLVFILEKIDVAPIYKLTIKGKFETGLTMNKFYTFEGTLPKFEIHDCGDFDG